MWTSKTSRSAVVSALLRDDGNLVLLDEMGSVVWQSFDNPSDTILPGQSLSIYKTLRAASKNSVSSYYSLYMNASGQLQLRWESDVMYWTSRNPSMSNLSAVLTSDGILQLVDQTLKPMWSVFGDDHNDAVNFRLLRLDVDGNLRMYSWEAVSKSWRSVWQAVENQCNVFATCGEHEEENMIWKKAALACMTSNSKGLMMLSFTEIKEITGNFKHQIGPKTYRGVLPNHQPVAIKELETTIEERKFRAAVSKIGSIHHRNLVKLNGYCCELGKKILVYEYVKNGSVHNYMEDDELSKRLTWRRRLNICLGVARAICYLHTGCREFVSHGTLKCENVVLDKNYEAKVSEFGLGIVHPEASCVREKDVEDVGKMLLILVTGCLQVGEVCELAYKEWIQGRPERVVDNRIDGGVDREELERMLRTAFWCLQSDERMRPSMGEVVKVLEGTLTVDPPPPPFASQSLPAKEALLESSSEP
ncbi:hypothetical protein GH714_032676 [Hevea brasiliensis]|uniref:Protein kinase domain-containing protein n=1 Tax=Hevea brasiliensis TaxID=3981 RepID=A0A6A6M4V7_HEVBR|nr:hypothetical protein GH714_032676 [Hevea brasiliensis]